MGTDVTLKMRAFAVNNDTYVTLLMTRSVDAMAQTPVAIVQALGHQNAGSVVNSLIDKSVYSGGAMSCS